LRAVFAGSSLELPEGVPPGVAVDLAEVLGADGVLYGAVEGSGKGQFPSLTVTLRLALAGSRELVRTASVKAMARQGEPLVAALREAASEAEAEVTACVGGPPLPGCFEPTRLGRVRALALAAGPAAPAHPREPPAPVAPAPATVRQAEWSSRLAAGQRFLVEGVTFDGRSRRITRGSGLEDLAFALRAAPTLRVRIEGFVDSTGRPADDLRLSLEMAQAAAERLSALGVPKSRLTFRGRGDEAPLLPNFTARGRARNRRVEVVPLPATASRP
jgi:outer membrane protein OmpA-like peptidoglycan-associated protein